MIYQPRNVQPSGVSIDGLLDNTFTMEIQTNSYVSAYQLLIVDFDNNEIYTGSKTTLTNYAYNGDTLEIPVSASTVALSNGINYKWRVRLYQPTADMLITYGLVQATSTTTTIYLQPNINIKAGMAITINSQTKTISSYNSDTGVAVVSSAFASAPAVGTQYKIYSDFIETVPDYIVYARQTPAVAISNVPSSLTLKYHTFQGTYTQSDNVAIVYHQFDLYTKNDDGTISLVASSDKVYSANLSYTYDSFRTGNKYLIQMTVENDMGVITTTDMYEFNVSYDIVEYLQQPLASFDDKNNAVKVSWVTPVENEATSFRSDAATGIIQDNNNTLTQATFEPGQSIGEGDVVQITNSDCSFIINGVTEQNVYSGKNKNVNAENVIASASSPANSFTNLAEYDGYKNVVEVSTNISYMTLKVNEMSNDFTEAISTGGIDITSMLLIKKTNANTSIKLYLGDITGGAIYNELKHYKDEANGWAWYYTTHTIPANPSITSIRYHLSATNVGTFYVAKIQTLIGSTPSDFEPYVGGKASPNPDYPQEIEVGRGKNLAIKNVKGYPQTSNSTIRIDNTSESFIFYAVQGQQYTFNSVEPTNRSIICKINTDNPETGTPYTNYETVEKTFISSFTGYAFLYVNSTLNDNIKNTFIINKGSTATSYLPYNTIESKSTGKNLLKGLSTSLTDGEYWFDVNKYYFTPLEDGWGKFEYDNTNGTSNVFINAKVNLSAVNLKKNTQYTILTEIRNSNISENSGAFFQVVTNNPTIAFSETSSLGYSNINTGGVFKKVLKTKESFNGVDVAIDSYLRLSKGTKGTVEARITLVEGDYTTKDFVYETYKESSAQYHLGDNFLADKDYIENGVLNKNVRHLRLAVADMNRSEEYPGWGNLTQLYEDYPNKNSSLHQVCNFKCNILEENNYGIGINTNSGGSLWLPTGIWGLNQTQWKEQYPDLVIDIYYELETPEQIPLEIVGDIIPQVSGKNYMNISISLNTTFSLKYPYKTISGNAYDYTEFNPPGAKQTGTIKSYNAITGVGTLMAQYPFTYIPMQGDSYAVISNIYNVSGFSYLYNTPYNTVNSLYTHGYTATWATPDGLCVLPDDFNITLQFSPDGNFYYTDNGTYQEIVNLITTETDDINNRGEFTIKIDKNKLIFTQQSEDGGSIVWDGNTEGKTPVLEYLYKVSDMTPSKEQLIGNQLSLTSPDGTINTFKIMAEDDGVSSDICYVVDIDDKGNYAIATLLPTVLVVTTPTTDFPSTGLYFISYNGTYVSELGLGSMILEAPFYTNTSQVFVLSSANIAQINNDYVWDDTATWTDTYTWVEGGTSLERVCNHWWKVQITNTGIKIEEIFPTT